MTAAVERQPHAILDLESRLLKAEKIARLVARKRALAGARVLDRGGVCYLAVPNKWVLLEPHFRLPFLSWIPERLRDPYVRAARRGERYDCNLPTRGRAAALFRAAGFDHEEVTVPAMRVLNELEEPSLPVRALCGAPEPVLRMLLPVNPTMIFLLTPQK